MLTTIPHLLSTHVIEGPPRARAIAMCGGSAAVSALLGYREAAVASTGLQMLLVLSACGAGLATMWSP